MIAVEFREIAPQQHSMAQCLRRQWKCSLHLTTIHFSSDTRAEIVAANAVLRTERNDDTTTERIPFEQVERRKGCTNGVRTTGADKYS